MAATFLVETGQWDRAESILPPSESKGDAAQQTAGANPYQAYAVLAEISTIFARGLAAAAHGLPDVKKEQSWHLGFSS